MELGDFSHCSVPRIKSLHKAHYYLCAKSRHYEKWHYHPHHKKVHFGVLGLSVTLFVILVMSSIFFPHRSRAAALNHNLNTKEQWSAGTNVNIDLESLPGSMKIKSAGSWGAMSQKNPPKPIANAGPAYESVGENIFVMRGGGDVDFWKFTPATDSWTVLADVPTGVNTGSDLCVGESSDVLYATVGGTTKKFYKYRISTNTWEARKDLSDTSGAGSSIVSNGTSVFYLRANASTDFFIYTIGDGSFDAGGWGGGANTGIGNIPTYGGNVGNGADMVWDGNNYIYSLKGGATQNWFRYTIDSNTWTAMTNFSFTAVNAPTSAIFYNGAMYIFYGSSTIATTFLRKCTISGTTCAEGATWNTLVNGASAPNPAPAITNFPGIGRVTSDPDNLYLFRGYTSYDVWQFNLPDNKFFMPPNFPIAVAAGADIFYNGTDTVYALMGGTNFYYWNRTTDTTWTQCTAVSTVCKNTNLPVMANDIKTVTVGNFVYLINYNTTALFRFDMSNPANGWSAVTVGGTAISNFGAGGGLAYVESANRIYAIRGANTNQFYYLDLTGDPNPTWTNAAGNYLPTGMNVNVGGRIVSVGTDVYVLLGNGNSTFYKWDGAAWTKMARTPFNPYNGTDLTSINGKIYALAGYYKSEFYEYSGTTWRRLENLYSSTSYDLGTSTAASLEFIGNNTLMATRGVLGVFGNSNLSMDVLTYTIDANNYQTSASYESQEFDLTYVGGWPSLAISKTEPNGSTVVIKSKTRNEGEAWPDTWTDLNGEGKIVSATKRYLKIQATLSPSAGNADTPILTSLGISYDPDEERPTPPTVATGRSQPTGGVDISSGTTYNYTQPYFEWNYPEEAGGATDNNKSGVAGYYVVFSTAADSDPATSGHYQTGLSFSSNEKLTSGTYYLRIKAKDRAGNVSETANTVFTYVYSGINSASPITKTLDAELSTNATLTNTTVSGDKVTLTGKAGFWKEGRLAPTPAVASITTGGSIVYKNDKVYMNQGGINAVESIKFYMYDPDPSVNSWVTKASLPAGAFIGDGGALVNGPGNYIYAMRGGGSGKFYRYDINNDAGGWVDADAEDAPDVFTSGGYLIQVGNYIYGIRGADWAFYRFNPNAGGADGLWESMTNINFGYPDRTAATTVGAGASLAYDGVDTIYAIQGASYQGGFSKYTISTNAWTPMTDTSFSPARDIFLPVAPSNYSHLMWDSTNSNLLYLAGNITGTYSPLYKFSPVTKEWTKLASTPGAVGAGAWWARDGDTIYLTRGAGTAFYKYSISKNYWYTPTFNIFGPQFNSTTYYPVGQGANLVKGDGNNVYAMRGVSDNIFVRYDTATGTTTKMANLPSATSNGYTSMVYDSINNNIYVMLGDTEAYLTKWFVYSIASNSWTEEAIISPATMGQPNAGASMTFDGTEYIYSTRGGSTEWYRYSVSSHTWSASLRINLLPSGNIAATAAGGEIIYKDGFIYRLRGGNSSPLYRVDVSGDPTGWNWTTVNTWAVTNGADGTLVDGGDGYMYGARAVAAVYDWYRCAFPTVEVPNPTWELLANVPGGTAAGGSSVANSTLYKIFNFTGAGTNSWNDGLYTFVEQTANSSFEESGTYISGAIDLTQTYRWANLSASYTQAANTTLAFYTQSSDDGATWSQNWDSVSEEKVFGTTHQFKIYSAEKRYIRVKAQFTSGDGVLTPTITDFTINYYLDQTAPTNPTTLTSAKSALANGVDIADDHWNKYTEPSFAWPASGAANGAVDNAGGSGIVGYYLYFGEAADGGVCQGDPRSTAGLLTPNQGLLYYQTGTTFTVPSSTLLDAQSGKIFCLRITTKDNAGNIQADPWQAFKYKFDNQAPSVEDTTVSVVPDGWTSIDSFAFTITPGATDLAPSSSLWKYEYRTDGDTAGEWKSADLNWNNSDPENPVLLDTVITIPNGDHPGGKYKTGINNFRVRIKDVADNASAIITKEYKFNNDKPLPPSCLVVDGQPCPTEAEPNEPIHKAVNDFTFSWGVPEGTPVGETVTYHYAVNKLPLTEGNTISTTLAGVSGALADQAGENTFYVVAEVRGLIDYNNYASVTFYADVSDPNPPESVSVSDISNKNEDIDPTGDSGEYRMVISWNQPTGFDASNFDHYHVYSTVTPEVQDSYTHIGDTEGTAFVHLDIEKDSTHYYFIKAQSKTQNESLPSNNPATTPTDQMPHETATGKFKFAPVINENINCLAIGTSCDSDKSVKYSIGARKATFSWSTSRNARPEIQYGLSPDRLDKPPAVGISATSSSHEVDVTGLNPETKYYYRVVFSDADGNVGYHPPLNESPFSFTTTPSPKVSTLKVENITLSSMTVTWQSSIASHGSVYFKESASTKFEEPIEESSNNYSTDHSAKLENLLSGTSYTFQINATDTEGNVFQSDEYVQATLPMPKVNDDLKKENKLKVDSPTINISYTTNVKTTTVINYSTSGGGAKTYVDLTKAVAHTAEISGLAPKATYIIEVTGTDDYGNNAIPKSFQITTESDTMPPKIVSMSEKKRVIGDGATAEAQITVKLTSNEPTTMVVEAAEGAGSGAFNIISNQDPLNTEHTVPLKLKQAGKTYSYRVTLKDATGNPTVSEVKTVVIQKANKTAFEYTLSIFSRSFGWLSSMFK